MMSQRRAPARDNSAAVAEQFGLSLKALRHYERLALIKPPRTRAGWRVFGPAECERLAAIVALKQLGLPLARIALLLDAGHADLDAFLVEQEETLLRAKCEADHALALVRIARERLRGRGQVGAGELADMVRRVARTVVPGSPELERVARDVLAPEQLGHVRASSLEASDAARLSAMWEEILAGLTALGPDADPQSGPSLAFGRRLIALFRERVGGDKEAWNSNALFWQRAVADPAVVSQLRVSRAQFDFVGQILTELNRRGEIHL